MGKGKPTIGYWYRVLIHFGLGRGPIDRVLEMRGGDRLAWQGNATGGMVQVLARNLWGGEKAEGGIEGELWVMPGHQDQEPLAILADNLGPEQSAYRGRATAAFIGLYGAFNPYPKPAAFLVSRIVEGWPDDAPWYPETATIGASWTIPQAVYITIDFSNSMNTGTDNGHSRLFNMRTALSALLDALAQRQTEGAQFDIFIGKWHSTLSSMTRRNADAADFVDLKAFLNSGGTGAGTYFDVAMEGAADFFDGAPTGARRSIIFITDGAPSPEAGPESLQLANAEAGKALLDALDGVSSFAFNIDLEDTDWSAYMDNTGGGGAVPVISGGDPAALLTAINATFGGFVSMNPAHMLYESLVHPDMQGVAAAEVDEASFTEAADRLYLEEFGLCTTWDPNHETVEDFQQRICNIIGGSLSQSRVDGKYYLTLVRGDVALDDLPILTDDDILEYHEEPGDPLEAVNQVIVEWYDPAAKEKRSTAPIQSLGAIQAAGGVISEVATYPEIPYETLALRIGARDLGYKALPLKRFKLTTNRKPYAWRSGTFFRLQAPRRGIADMVCTVGQIDAGTPRSGSIRLVALQDLSNMPATTYVQPEPGIDTSPSQVPAIPELQRLVEAPYLELAGILSAADLGALTPEAGYLVAMAGRPSTGLNYTLTTAAAGEALEDRGTGDWCPTATILEAGARDDTQTDFTFTDGTDLSLVQLGTVALWGDELVRIDALDTDLGTITLGRGCGDTPVQLHDAGETLWCFDQWSATDAREYGDGEDVTAQLLTRTASQELDPSLAPVLELTFDGRPARPYAPGRLRIDDDLAAGQIAPEEVFGEITLDWAHRDRLLQADQAVDANAASIGPEPGTTYTVEFYVDGVLDATESGISGTASTPITLSTGGPCRVDVFAVRDGLTSWLPARMEFDYYLAPFGVRITDANDTRTTDAGDRRITE